MVQPMDRELVIVKPKLKNATKIVFDIVREVANAFHGIQILKYVNSFLYDN